MSYLRVVSYNLPIKKVNDKFGPGIFKWTGFKSIKKMFFSLSTGT